MWCDEKLLRNEKRHDAIGTREYTEKRSGQLSEALFCELKSPVL